eukprot:scaffold149229_cov60-Attheya_sp.AAC.3
MGRAGFRNGDEGGEITGSIYPEKKNMTGNMVQQTEHAWIMRRDSFARSYKIASSTVRPGFITRKSLFF